MSAPRLILASLPSFCQKLYKLVKLWRSSDKNNFAHFFLRHGVLTISENWNCQSHWTNVWETQPFMYRGSILLWGSYNTAIQLLSITLVFHSKRRWRISVALMGWSEVHRDLPFSCCWWQYSVLQWRRYLQGTGARTPEVSTFIFPELSHFLKLRTRNPVYYSPSTVADNFLPYTRRKPLEVYSICTVINYTDGSLICTG